MSAGSAALRRLGHRAPRTVPVSVSRIQQTPRSPLLAASSSLRSASRSPAHLRQLSRFSTMSPLQAAPAVERDYDPEIKDMADFIHNYKVESDLAVRIPLDTSIQTLMY